METALQFDSLAYKKSYIHYVFYKRLCKSAAYNHCFIVYAGFGTTYNTW